MTDESRARIYLLLPPAFDPEAFVAPLAEALRTGQVACVRLDLGTAPEEEWRRAVNFLMPACHEADVPLVVTDHFRLVRPLGLDGVHLAQSRTPLREVRKAIGKDAILGAFGGAARHRAMSLAEAGADYVALGPVRDPGALGDGATAEDALFEWWAEMIETPSVAEGGVTLEDAARLGPVADFVTPDPALIWEAPGGPGAAVGAFAEALGGD